MSKRYSRGSVWRRWDLHVHAPGTLRNNQFGDVEEYIEAIESMRVPPAVLGITDYCTIEGYKTIRGYKLGGRLKKVKLLMPNVEFRITPSTKAGKAINIHLLVDPEPKDHIELLEEALSKLTFKFKGQDYSCTLPSLRRLGAKCDPKQSDPRGQLMEGVNQFKPSFEMFRDWYQGHQWLRSNSFVAVEVGSSDGTAGLQHDDGFKALRKEIQGFPHIVFSTNLRDRGYWLGDGPDSSDIIIEEYGSLKPCVASSDAHSIEKLITTDPGKYCWIKADPTFEGLRQIIYEPRERVWIGEEPPSRPDKSLVISHLEIAESNGWFKTDKIPLNPGLVTVIGARGSGKTALSDLIAYAASSHTGEKSSFLGRAIGELTGTKLTIRWGDGTKVKRILGRDENYETYRSVKYLSQNFVERLCSDDQGGDELRTEVEKVVFSSLDPTERYHYSSLGELLEDKLRTLEEEETAATQKIQSLNRHISSIDYRQASLADLNKKREAVRSQKQIKKQQIDKIKLNKDDSAVASKLSELQQQHQAKTKVIASIKKKQQEVSDLLERTEFFLREMEKFWREFIDRLTHTGLEASAFLDHKPLFSKDPRPILVNHLKKLEETIAGLRGDPESPAEDTLLKISSQIEATEKTLKIDLALKNQFSELRKDIDKLGQDEEKLDRDIKEIKEDLPRRRTQYTQERFGEYGRRFALIGRKGQILQRLYEPLRSRLREEGEQEKKLELYIKRTVAVDEWVEEGEKLFDGRKLKKGTLGQLAHEHISRAWSSDKADEVVEAMRQLIQAMLKCNVLDFLLDKERGLVDFADWLFGLDHISLEYGIRYDSTELEKLSPGAKGIVLLILYLAIDIHDTRPLIVDQPEENLDNQSVFDMLIGYFREVKTRRQVILITHNPNLVVNTDADQVIVAWSERRAGGLPSIGYAGGGLEAIDLDELTGMSVRQAVIGILEGGEEAFKMRERKLGFAS